MSSVDGFSSIINNAIVKQFNTQGKIGTGSTINNNENSEQEKMISNMLFQTLFSQILGDSGNPVASEALMSAMNGENSLNLTESLGTVNNFNSSIRQASQTFTNDTGYKVNDTSGTLGIRASKYESNLNPADISNTPGDIGGKSYGAWQFSSKTGSLDSFINSLKGTNTEVYTKLAGAKAKDGNSFGSNFDNAWKNIASSDKEGFLKLQQDYIKKTYFDKAAQDLKSKYGFDINTKSAALKESLWSTVVQHGVGGAKSIFSKLNLNNSDKNIINDLYNERQKVNKYFRDSSAQVKQSVYNRFTREKQDMLSMLNQESKSSPIA